MTWQMPRKMTAVNLSLVVSTLASMVLLILVMLMLPQLTPPIH